MMCFPDVYKFVFRATHNVLSIWTKREEYFTQNVNKIFPQIIDWLIFDYW
jgi:hypothetical protein